jgi:hypothetical protein
LQGRPRRRFSAGRIREFSRRAKLTSRLPRVSLPWTNKLRPTRAFRGKRSSWRRGRREPCLRCNPWRWMPIWFGARRLGPVRLFRPEQSSTPARMPRRTRIHRSATPSPWRLPMRLVSRTFRRRPPPRPPPHAAVAESHRPAVAAPPEPSVLLSAPAREIRLQLSGGEQRVDVRLTEHRGEVQVAVRTPDSRLTEALRSDLPALSARLEQNGFRAETWHPASSRPEHAGFTPEPSSSGSAPQGDGGERHRNPQDHEAPPRRAPLAEDRPDSPPPEFSWLLSSLR